MKLKQVNLNGQRYTKMNIDITKNKTMKLSDNIDNYKNKQDIVNRYVLYEYGKSYSENRIRKIVKVRKVTKTGFRIEEHSGLFDFEGWQKGLDGRFDMGTISRCYLLTEEEVDNIVKIWEENKRKKALLKEIEEKLNTDLSLKVLEKINDLINKGNH